MIFGEGDDVAAGHIHLQTGEEKQILCARSTLDQLSFGHRRRVGAPSELPVLIVTSKKRLLHQLVGGERKGERMVMGQPPYRGL